MLNLINLSTHEAKKLIDFAEKSALEKGFKVSIAVVDHTTFLQAFLRMDGAPLFSAEGAYDKARTSAEGGHPTTFFEKPLNEGRFSMVKLPHTPIEGGLPLIFKDQCIGAIAVAGAPPHIDSAIAQDAINQFFMTVES
jgi:glc operon protein GlcG